MSLINDMLKDLDTRRARTPGAQTITLPAGDVDTHDNVRVAILATVGTITIAGLLALVLITDVPAQIKSYVGANLPETGQLQKEFAARAAPTSADSAAVADALPAGAGLPANRDDPDSFAGKPAPAANTDANEPVVAIATHAAGNRQQAGPAPGIAVRTLSPAERADRLYRDAMRAAAAGRSRDAMESLQQVLQINANHRDARMLQVRLYIRNDRYAEAGALLRAGRSLDPGYTNYARTQAQLLVAQNRDAQAIQVLEDALAITGNDAGLHALLAGLYRRAGTHNRAIPHYRAAVELAPQNGKWWMGLGLAEEQAGDPLAAQHAYRQALERPLDDSLQQFIGGRLRALQDANTAHSDNTDTGEQG